MWAAEYNKRIARSSISDILSSRYQYLDSREFQRDQERTGPEKWVVLKEQIQDLDSILDEIVAWHGPKIEAESDEDIEEQVSIIKEVEALSAIQVLCQYMIFYVV